MKKLLAQFCFVLLLISCGNEPKKEKFSYERVKVEEKTETNSNLLVLNSNDQMLFDKSVLKAKAGEEVNLLLNHTGQIGKEFMGHNFVLLKKDVDVIDFATKAMIARDSDYIPEGNETIAYTKMIGGGESDTIVFDAPEKGTYNYICSFPGHYGIMKGILIVK